jgi:serine/threonine protein kinase
MLEANSILQRRYRIIRQLGRGGMGTVFEAIDERINRSVVLKRASFTTPDRVKDFEREAQLLGNLRHPALPQVSDHFVEDGGQYLVMDFVPGNDLAELLALLGRPFPLPDVLRWADELLKVLEYLHRYSPPILHRDIKPANLKLTKDGEIFLLDFGLAKGTAGQMPTIGQALKSIAGYTPNYAPLEQILRADNESPDRFFVDSLASRNPEEVERILSRETDVRADLYSLAATIYHLLTNVLPCNAARRTLTVWNGQPDPIRPVREENPLVPDEVSTVLERAMALMADDRPPSATAMRSALKDASLSLRMPGQIALNQLSQQAVESIVQLALERLLKQTVPEVAQNRNDIAQQADRIRELEIHQELVKVFLEKAKEKRTVSLEELAPNVIYSITRQAVEQISDQKALFQIVESIVKKELAQHTARVPTSVKPETVPGVIQAGKKADKETPNTGSEKAPDAIPKIRRTPRPRLPVEVRGEEEERLHKDARRFARLLVTEIMAYNEEKLKEGRQRGGIYDRLRAYIDGSREMYLNRVKPEVTRRYDYFHHELINTLAEGDLSKMGNQYPGDFSARR